MTALFSRKIIDPPAFIEMIKVYKRSKEKKEQNI